MGGTGAKDIMIPPNAVLGRGASSPSCFHSGPAPELLTSVLPGRPARQAVGIQPLGIAFLIGQLGIGGAEQQLYYLLSGLDRARFQPLVISFGRVPGEYWEDPIRRLGIEVECLPLSLGRWRRTLRVAQLLRRNRILVAHSWTFHTNPYVAVAGRLAGVPLRLGSMREHRLGVSLPSAVRPFAIRGLDGLVTNSAMTAEHLRATRPAGVPVSLVANAVVLREKATDIVRSRLRSDLGVSAEHLVIGTIGRLDANKNHTMLLRAAVPLSERHPTLRLILIGDGPLRSELLAQAGALGLASRVILPGVLPSAARFLDAMDICCLTSHTEGMPNVIMEASAAGLPVVSTLCGGSAELIQDGVTGFLISPGDQEALSARLASLLADPRLRHRMGEAGRAKMRNEFSVTTMVAGMTRVFEAALTAKGLS